MCATKFALIDRDPSNLKVFDVPSNNTQSASCYSPVGCHYDIKAA
jgi:hypothetical protein